MHITRLRLENLRTWGQLEWAPAAGINLLIGENAQGKTNVLESVYLLATSRSPRTSRDGDLIRSEAAEARVAAEVSREIGGETLVEVQLFRGEPKVIRVNGSRCARIADGLGRLNAVYFGSGELSLVQGEPGERRRFLNLDISQIRPRYAFDLAGYKRVLEQRNRMLKDIRDQRSGSSALFAWNEQLVQYGSALMERRREFLRGLGPLAAEVHRFLTDGSEELEVRYAPCFALRDSDSSEALQDRFREELERVAMEEMRRGTSCTGPQRDDISLQVDGMDARTFASQGQQRTAALSLKLAEFALMRELAEEPPVLLLDDVMSDLDPGRRERLMHWLCTNRCQSMLTGADALAFPGDVRAGAAICRVRRGVMVTG